MSKYIEALYERVTVPAHLLSSRPEDRGDHYVLRVVGDSLLSEGLHDGDYIIVLRRDQPEPGEMVVCVVGTEATVKRYYAEGNGIVRLQPANPETEPIRLPAANVHVQGIVVGLMRKF